MPNTTPIGEDALREALWICVEHNALHFGERHNTVVQGRAALAGAAPAAQGDRCAAVCERIGNEYAESDRFKCPEMKMDAESGARSCAYAIRAGDGEAGNA